MQKKIAIMLGIIFIAGAGFYGGMRYGQSKSASVMQQDTGRGGAGGRGGRGLRGGGGFTSGEILSKDDTGITVKMRDGGSKIVFYSGTTEISKLVSGAVSDLEVGKTVSVMGSANPDGSVTAQSIQLRADTMKMPTQ